MGGWHEAGPAAGLLARRWALEVLRVLNERGHRKAFDCLRIFALDPAQSARKIRQLANAHSMAHQ